MGYALNGDIYEWVEDEVIEVVEPKLIPGLEERMSVVEGAIIELAEVISNG